MRGEDDVVEAAQRPTRTGRPAPSARPGRRRARRRRCGRTGCARAARGVDDHAAGGVDEQRARLHLRELLGAEEPGVPGPAVDVQRDDVGLGEQLVEGAHPAGVAVREPVGGVVEDDAQAERLGDGSRAGCRCCRSRRCRACGRGSRGCPWPTCPRRRRACAAVFSASRRASTMISPITSSTTLRVLEYGALKTATPRSAARRQVDLVGADAEAADGQQVGGAPRAPAAVIVVLERMPSRWTPGRAATSSSSDSAAVRSSTSKPGRLEAARRRRDGCSRAAAPSRSPSLGGIPARTDSATPRGRRTSPTRRCVVAVRRRPVAC